MRMLGIRPGEARIVALIGALFAAVEAGRGFGEIGVDTVVLRRLGASVLPWLYIGLGVAGLGAALIYGAGFGRIRRDRFVPGLLVLLAALLGAERLAILSGAPLVHPALWITVNAVGALLITAAWTVATAALDTRQAKRLFPLCTGAAIAGGFAGTLGAGPAAAIVGAENLVLVEAACIAAAAAVAASLAPQLRRGAPAVRRGSAGRDGGGIPAGFDEVRRSPLMRLVAVSYVLFAVLLFSASFPFLTAMSAAFPDEAELATALGLFSAAVTATSLVVSLLLANRLYARFGVTAGALVLPVVYLAGFIAWLVQFSLATVVAVRFVQQITQRGVSNTAWSTFFTILPAARRGQVLAFIDGVPGQLGTVLSGMLLLVAASLAFSQVLVLGAIAAAACTIVVAGIRRRYAPTLLRTLREGPAEQVLDGGPGLATLGRDPGVGRELRLALQAPSPGERRLAADLLGRIAGRDAAPDLVALLADPDATVRGAALDALAASGGLPADAPVPALGDDPSPAVRAALAAALAGRGEEAAARGLVEALLSGTTVAERVAGLGAIERLSGIVPAERALAAVDDPAPEIRAAALRAAAATGDDGIGPVLLRALDDDAWTVRRAAAAGIARGGSASPALLDLLDAGSGRAQDATVDALAGMDDPGDETRQRLRRWAARQVERARDLRTSAAALGDGRAGGDGRALGDGRPGGAPDLPDDGAAGYLAFLLRSRAAAIEARLLRALVVLGVPDAGGLIRRSLGASDPEVRAQAVEALDSLGDRRLGRAIVGLFEGAAVGAGGPTSRDVAAAARGLGADPDPWVRALALRTLAEHLDAELRQVVDQARTDPDPVVRAAGAGAVAAGPPGSRPDVPETRATLADIERMLLLRRVPLFAALAPEDLQRIAAAATEVHHAPGEALMRKGDPGDGLIVLVEGTARAIRRDGPGGAERLLRTFSAGDHLGELAVLRSAPRSATVIADEPGVRGLVIAGEGLRAILRERPEAAMAMLATLAERISSQ